jgi:hypothetical protein
MAGNFRSNLEGLDLLGGARVEVDAGVAERRRREGLGGLGPVPSNAVAAQTPPPTRPSATAPPAIRRGLRFRRVAPGGTG